MDARRLLIFREVARLGSLSQGATALGWTQPAVSQHVQRLERDVGLPLVLRSPRGITLTEAGTKLLAHADALAARLAAAESDLQDLADLRSGSLTLVAFPSAAAVLVPPVLAALPDTLDLRLTEAEPPEARQQVLAGEAALALVFEHSSTPSAHEGRGAAARSSGSSGPAASGPAASAARASAARASAARASAARGSAAAAGGVVARPPSSSSIPARAAGAGGDLVEVVLFEEELKAVVAEGHRLAGRKRVGLEELAQERWIAGCPRCEAHLLSATAEAGFAPDIRHRTDDYVVVQRLVAEGLAVSLLPQLAVTAAPNPRVRVLPVRTAPTRRVSVILRTELAGHPAVAAAVEQFRLCKVPA
ncbi:LysR family transcriptional regulator [Kribbella sp. CA-253562]|uniref:LysR family transcriptional regulator n=1 Tax=Kribbella sp. CA-253562 TaxID=3239942 RepID=UPI003D8F7A83